MTVMSATLPQRPLSLREVLLVHFLVFQEAVLALPIYEFDFTGPLSGYSPYPVYEYQLRPNQDRVPVDIRQFHNDEVYRAIVMRLNCDNFCVRMERFVQSNIQRLLSTTISVSRIVFMANSRFRTTSLAGLRQEEMHSCLLVTEDNREMILDGTIDQYGLNWRTSWLLTREEAMDSHMGYIVPRSDKEWEEIRESLLTSGLD
ncbi:hypothetical protein A1F94_002971 [Pyrenophora tritici-repentis]|nr:hypothetical protein A1F94_002971 [Pyrenophora tritici-repentis]PZD01609.1 hypothetical protein A1F95_02296 [Pyrenophora tritici-repentis]